MVKQGLFVAFDGPDGAGKSSVLAGVKDWLGGEWPQVSALFVREPGGTPVGEAVRRVLLDRDKEMLPLTEAYLFAASRAELTHAVILPHLKNGGLVISDRYVDSSLVYQGAGRGLGMELVAAVNAAATGGLTPDLSVFLLVDPTTAAARQRARAQADRLESAGEAFAARVDRAYRELAEKHPEKIAAVDAGRPLGEVIAAACFALDAALRRAYGG